MLKAVFTLDYEIHGNGSGCPYALMIEPTERMLKLFDQYGAKLTIMADIGEILKFRHYFEQNGQDSFHYQAIAAQLQDAVRRGHDVQLHIHSSYFNASHEKGKWRQDWSEYDFAKLDLARMNEMVSIGKTYLENLLGTVDPNYRCTVFRAANWSVSPSQNVVKTLLDNQLAIDTSVFKYGKREGRVNFDYRHADSELLPWRVDTTDICKADPSGKLWEVPIYTEERWLGAFLTLQRVHRAYLSRLHKFDDSTEDSPPKVELSPKTNKLTRLLNQVTQRHAWKADFNQCAGNQLIAALGRADAKFGNCTDKPLPFVLIGHSKLFTRLNEWSLRPFLAHVEKNPARFGFAKFGDFGLSESSGT